MKTFGFEANKSIAVLGLGPVALLSFVQFARLMGMGPIIAMDLSDEKLELARLRGADAVVNSSREDIETAVRAVCPQGVDFALDAVGVPDFINTGLSIIKPGAENMRLWDIRTYQCFTRLEPLPLQLDAAIQSVSLQSG